MKKLMRKLVLSSFALGLAVITLSTTTFAWYTSNKNVTANNIVGTSSTSGEDLLMITQDKEVDALPTNWGTSVSVNLKTSEHDANGTNGIVDMSPMGYDKASHKFITMTGSNVTDGYLTFTLYFKLASSQQYDDDGDPVDTNLYVSKFKVTNTTDGGPAEKDILANGHSSLGVEDTKQTYSVDILRTLMVVVESQSYPETDGTGVKDDEPVLYDIWDLEGLNKPADDFADTLQGKTEGTGFNAHTYYNAIMCSSKHVTVDNPGTPEVEKDDDCVCIETTQKTYDAKQLKAASADTDKLFISALPHADNAANSKSYLEVTFKIFINGWDYACFDACQGQTFTVELDFTTIENNALTF